MGQYIEALKLGKLQWKELTEGQEDCSVLSDGEADGPAQWAHGGWAVKSGFGFSEQGEALEDF